MAAIQLQGANLRNAQLQGAELMGAQLQKAFLVQAQLQEANLRNAQLKGANLGEAQLQKANLRDAQLQEVNLGGAQLQKVNLGGTQLQKANLRNTQLQEATLWGAQLQGASLWKAQLQGAFLARAQLQGADLRGSNLDGATLDGVTLNDEAYGAVRLADVRWGEVNLAVVEWGHLTKLGDEQRAHQIKDDKQRTSTTLTRVEGYKVAVRANLQLAVGLREQGLNEDADHFAYRAQVLQRELLRLEIGLPQIKLVQLIQKRWQRVHKKSSREAQQYKGLWKKIQEFEIKVQKFGSFIFSLFLAGLTGYGFKPGRWLIVYLGTITVFAVFHYFLGMPHTTWLSAFAISVLNLHGRPFLNPPPGLEGVIDIVEAFFGLVIEAVLVAIITQRILRK